MARSSSRPHSAVDIRRWIISCGGPADTAILLPLPPTSQTTRIWNTFLKRGHSVPSSLPLGGPHIAHRTSTYWQGVWRLFAIRPTELYYTHCFTTQPNLQPSSITWFYVFFSLPLSPCIHIGGGGWTGELGPMPASTGLGITVGRRRSNSKQQQQQQTARGVSWARRRVLIFLYSVHRLGVGMDSHWVKLGWTGLDRAGLGPRSGNHQIISAEAVPRLKIDGYPPRQLRHILPSE